MSIEYLDLADFIAIAAEVTGLDQDTIAKVADLGLADSALHALSAQFGDREFYEDFIDKAAVPIVRLAQPPTSRRQQARRLGFIAHISSH